MAATALRDMPEAGIRGKAAVKERKEVFYEAFR